MARTIFITEGDLVELRQIIDHSESNGEGPYLANLQAELGRAKIVPAEDVPRDVVTMNSRALLQLDDEEMEVTLVYPEDADHRAGKLSVCSDVGTAILGYREGDAFDWRMPDRTRHIRIGKVLYQPEAAGNFHL